MINLTIEEKYQAELAQSEIDHHKPTAGAMTNHILANLLIQTVKLQQSQWYVKGEQALGLSATFAELVLKAFNQFQELGDLLLDENQKPSSTTDEFKQYSMLEEAAQNKYQTASAMVTLTIKDFDTNNLFIDRAIKLAEKENRPVLGQFLIQLRGQNNQSIRQLQAFLGSEARDGLDEEDED